MSARQRWGRGGERGLLVGVVGAIAIAFAGCTQPCELDADCPSQMHCGPSGMCEQQCASDRDCDSVTERCERGRCTLDIRPVVTWLSPAEGADVGERFDIEVEVRFRGAEVVVELQRDPTNPGVPCAPHVPRRVVLQGDPAQEVVEKVSFRDVPSLGSSFGLQVRASVASIDPFTHRRGFRGSYDATLGGIEVTSPREGFVDADANVSLPLELALGSVASRVTAWVEPAGAAPTPKRVIASNAGQATGRVPLARGEQILWIEAESGTTTSRCGVGLATERTALPEGVELALAFDAPEPANLDLWVYADLDEDGQSRCTLEPPSGICAIAWTEPGLREHGEELVVLPSAEGIYGVAVSPAAATEPVSALVRVSNRGIHLGFFGPRSVLANQAEVWLAGRVLVLGGTVTLQPLDRVSTGLPSEPASSW